MNYYNGFSDASSPGPWREVWLAMSRHSISCHVHPVTIQFVCLDAFFLKSITNGDCRCERCLTSTFLLISLWFTALVHPSSSPQVNLSTEGLGNNAAFMSHGPIHTAFFFAPTGAFKTVSSSHQTSSNASMRIAGSSRLLAQSMRNREKTEELKSSLTGPGSGLEALQGELAFSPNLTPVINKVKLI